MSIYQTIKKYFLFLSVFFVFTISIHLVFLYVSEDALRVPEEGGTINIGIIGSVPNLNPATYGTDPLWDYLLRFVSRSLLRYNVSTKQMEGDLANCNLGKNFSEIKCYVKNDARWNDGTPVTKEDILATYQMFQHDDLNKTAKKILSGITIEDQGEYIQFSGKADVLVLDMLLYPIIRKDIVEKIKKDSFSISENVSSGPYIFEKRETDDTTNHEKVSFVRNGKNIQKNIYIGRYIFRFFDDKNELIANKDSLNIIFPHNSIDTFSSPRFHTYKFILPEYISLFLNVEKLGPELRNIILGSLSGVRFASLDEETGRLLKNPFFTDESILPITSGTWNIETTLKNMGYFKKEVLSAQFSDVKTEPKIVADEVYTYFESPSNKKYFVTKESDFLISGNTPAGITGVFINDYRLRTFVPKDRKFYYRANVAIWTLKNGANTYTLAFEVQGKKIPKETMTIFLATTDEEREKQQKIYTESLLKEKISNLAQEEKKINENQNILAKIAPLDGNYYYNKNLEKFSLAFAYTQQVPYMKNLATEIANRLKTLGVDVVIKTLSTDDLQTIISKGEKQYSMILTGINLGLFDYNIFPFLHSWQAEKGFNFAKLKDIGLDILLERLKSSQFNSDSLKIIESQILEILKKDNVFAPLYSPYNTLYVDKNLKQFNISPVLPYSSSIYDLGENSYLKEQFTIQFAWKSLLWFMEWMKQHTPIINF